MRQLQPLRFTGITPQWMDNIRARSKSQGLDFTSDHRLFMWDGISIDYRYDSNLQVLSMLLAVPFNVSDHEPVGIISSLVMSTNPNQDTPVATTDATVHSPKAPFNANAPGTAVSHAGAVAGSVGAAGEDYARAHGIGDKGTQGTKGVSVLPSTVQVQAGKTVIFSIAGDTGHEDYVWTLDGAKGAEYGTVDTTGLYTAPTAVPTVGMPVHVRATAVGDPSRFGEAVVTVVAAVR
jgi:hypothetical protein